MSHRADGRTTRTDIVGVLGHRFVLPFYSPSPSYRHACGALPFVCQKRKLCKAAPTGIEIIAVIPVGFVLQFCQLGSPSIVSVQVGGVVPITGPFVERLSGHNESTRENSPCLNRHFSIDGRNRQEHFMNIASRHGPQLEAFAAPLCRKCSTAPASMCTQACFDCSKTDLIGAGYLGSANAPTATPIIAGRLSAFQ